MNKQASIDAILQLCGDRNGFFVQLRNDMVFDERLYQSIFKAFSDYLELIDNEEDINRRVARCLVDFLGLLEGEAYQFGLRGLTDESRRIWSAHADVTELTYKLLP